MHFFSVTIALLALGSVVNDARAQVFMNDSFRVIQESTTSFDVYINGERVRRLSGDGALQANFSQRELAGLLLANDDLKRGWIVRARLSDFVALDLTGLMSAQITDDNVAITFERQLITESRSGQAGFKYTGPRGRERSLLVGVSGIGTSDVPPDLSSPQLFPTQTFAGLGDTDSRGGKGPYFNDMFTITQFDGYFVVNINGVELTRLADQAGDIIVQINTDTFEQLVLENNGVSGSFLREDTYFFNFLAMGNAGLIDVALRSDNISFSIAREFVTSEIISESLFEYNALGQRAGNFINFVGTVDSPPD
jgi:hypothetical protein